MDSDSDLQAYINELSRKTHDLQYGDSKSASRDESELSHSSNIEIPVKKVDHSIDVENIEKRSVQTNKFTELEEKYLKRALKSAELNLSSSFSEYNLDETTLDSSAKTSENPRNIKTSQIQEVLNSLENKTSLRQADYLKSLSFEEAIKEESSLISQNNSQRKVSDSSSLLNKSSIFYSTNDKAGKQRQPGQIIFRMRSITLSESDTISSDVTGSVSEEIPEVLQNENIQKITKDTLIAKEDGDESRNYEENTFENSEDSSAVKNTSNNSKLTSESVSSQKSNLKSSTESTVSEEPLSEGIEEEDNSKTVISLKEHYSTSTEESNTNNSTENSDVTSQDDSNQKTSVKSQNNRSSSRESSSTNRESNISSIQYSHQKSKKVHHKTKKVQNETHKTSHKSDKTRVKDNNNNKEQGEKNKKRSKIKRDISPSPPSSLVTSVLTSSSSSFYVKMKNKKYREKKRKLKQEKELTELIIKLLIKNLPIILRQTIGLSSTAELLHQQPRKYVCHHCGGNSVGFDLTQKRIDDVLRQTVDLTKQFMESQKTLMETRYSHLNSNYRYTTLRNYST